MDRTSAIAIALGLSSMLVVGWLLGVRSAAAKGGRSMLGQMLEGRLTAFEQSFGYNLGYARDIIDSSTMAFMRFGLFFAFARHQEDAPNDAMYAVKIVAARHEDCGPCTQLVVTMAEKDGVSAKTLRGILAGDVAAMGEDASLGYRFAKAVLAHDLAEGERLREEVLARWGRKGLVSLAFAVASSRVYPGIKYALGYGRTCSRVAVGGEDAVLDHRVRAMTTTE